MALVTNNISGSSAGNWRIGVTGSVTIANPGSRPWPKLPGVDVDLFVSGNIGGVGAGSGVTVFGGDVVLSGTLHGGSPLKIGTDVGVTGSLALNNVAAAPTAGANEAVLYARAGTLYFKNAGGGETAVGSGGGGGGGGPFTESTNVAAFTTSSIAIGLEAVANTKGTDVFFFVSGSTDGQKAALFGGTIVTSGSLNLTSDAGEIAHIGGNGEISGSGALQAGGNLTVGGTALVVGTSTLTGDVTFGGNIVADADEAKSIFTAVTSNAITIGNGTSTATVRNLTVNGSTITATTPTSINLGDTAATVNVGQSGTSNTLNVRGNANITGNAVVSGDLTVNGTTTTVSTTNLLVRDPLLYIGSGSAAGVVAYGGLALASGSATADNAMVFVKDSSDVWAVGRQDVTAGTRTNTTSLNYIPLRASSLQLGGTVGSAATTANVYLTSSDGSSAILNVKSSGNSLAFAQGGTNKILFGDYAGSGEAIIQGQNGEGVTSDLWISGTNINIGHTTNNAIQILGNDKPGGRLSIDGTLPNLVFNIAARNATSAFAMSLTGSGVTLGSNDGKTFFQFANLAYAEAAVDIPNSSGFKVGAVAGKSLLVSGSTILANAGAAGFRVQRDGSNVGSIQGIIGSSLILAAYTGNAGPSFGTATQLVLTGSEVVLGSQTAGVVNFQQAGGTHLSILKNANTTLITGSANQNVTLAAGAGTTALTLSGSTVIANTGNGGFVFIKDGATELHINALGSTTTISGSATQNVTIAAGTGATTVEVSGSIAKITGGTSIDFFKDTTRIAFVGASPTNNLLGLHPNSDVTYNLGSPERRWANIYTGDLHLRNDRGDWTIIEERDYLSITNNYNGKRYKFVLEEI